MGSPLPTLQLRVSHYSYCLSVNEINQNFCLTNKYIIVPVHVQGRF